MEKYVLLSAVCIGISSILVQLVFMRESLNLFAGNELTLGLVFFSWLTTVGIGSYLGRFLKAKGENVLLLYLNFLSTSPVLLLLLVRYLRVNLFTYGAALDLRSVLILCFFFLFPYCLVSGSSFPMLCSMVRREDVRKVYWADSVGDLLGSVLFTLLIFHLNLFQILFLNFLVCSSAFLLFCFFRKKKWFFPTFLTVIVLSFLMNSLDLNMISLGWMYRGQEIVYQKDSLYGNLVVTRTGDQLNFYENNVLLFSTQNFIGAEETVHYAMVQHREPKKVLILSGGISGTLDEALKYDPELIDYVELDPEIIRIGKVFGKVPKDERIRVHTVDARFFVKNVKGKYDIIILDLPDPSTTQLNRFYTVEFFEEVKIILNDSGIVSLSLSSHENYMSPETRKLNSAIYKSLKSVFRNVLVIPGGRNFFIASDADLTYSIPERIEELGIPTKYVNEYYLSAKLTSDRINYVLHSLVEEVEINRDFEPITYHYYLLYWLSKFHSDFQVFTLVALGILFLALILLRFKPINLAVFTTGFIGSGMELVLLLTFQTLYGYLYSHIGILLTVFMVGLISGTHSSKKFLKPDFFIISEFLASLLCFGVLILITLHPVSHYPILLIPTFLFFLGFLVGFEFPLATTLMKGKKEKVAGEVFFSDMLGGSMGALIVSLLFFPHLGLAKSCAVMGLMNFLTGILVLRKFS